MRNNFFFLIAFYLISILSTGQSVQGLMDKVTVDGVTKTLRELSGEEKTMVGGKEVTIQHRVSNKGNDLAADFIKERLESFGLNVEDIQYRNSGRNIVGTKLGEVNPDNIYMICGHYDTTNDHGADDNGSGTTAVLEVAKILSEYSFENTIKFALWDEEEIGLVGAKNYAKKAKSDGDNILAVLNMDMAAYDGDGDKLFDIDVKNVANSYQIRDDLLSVLSKYNIDLKSKVVDPGTESSDHAAFWSNGFSAVLLGEAWSKNDITPHYHSDKDRINVLDMNYFHKMVKLAVGYISTKAVLLSTGIEDSFSETTFKLFPNPAKELVNIEFGGVFIGKITVFDLKGNEVLSKNIKTDNLNLDLRGLENAVYLIQAKNFNGKMSKMKLVKE